MTENSFVLRYQQLNLWNDTFLKVYRWQQLRFNRQPYATNSILNHPGRRTFSGGQFFGPSPSAEFKNGRRLAA